MTSNPKFYLTKRENGYFYIGWYDNGRRRWKSTKCTAKSDAFQYLRQYKVDFQETEVILTLSALMDKFITLKGNSVRPNTLALYKVAVERFKTICGDKVLDSYTVSDVDSFKNALLAQGHTKHGVNIKYRGVKSVFGFALRSGMIDRSVFQKTKPFPTPQQTPEYLTQEDFHRLLAVVKEPVLRDIYLFASLTGMRISEILDLTWDKVDFEKRQIVVSNSATFTTKTGKVRVLPMHDKVLSLLSDKKERKSTSTRVFHNSNGFPLLMNHVSKRFKDYVRLAGLSDNLHFHSLRHTCASWLVDAGVSLYVVQNILGHSNISTTQIYSHLSQNTLQESVNRVSL
jgi:site-specific recombinase XerD